MIRKVIFLVILFIFLLSCYAVWKKNKILMIISGILVFLLILCYSYEKTRQNYTQPRLRKLVSNIIEKFNDNKVKYWVDYGTLLGIARDGDIIKHDTDTDLCLFPSESDNGIESKLVKITNELGPGHRLTYTVAGNKPEDRLYRIYQNSNFMMPVYTDIYVTVFEDGKYVDISGKLPSKLLGQTKTIKWNGVDVVVPEKIHETLVWRYGESYMTPIAFKPNERYKDILKQEGFMITDA